MKDVRKTVAKFYDAKTQWTKDIPFYKKHVSKNNPTVLELGCGTGRVTLPLAQGCDAIVGVDRSEAMLEIAEEKREKMSLSPSKIEFIQGDIIKIDLKRQFGLIIAPYRVLQNLASNAEVDGFFEVIQKHLSPDGFCILNVFNPATAKAELMKKWSKPEEILEDEELYESGVLKSYVIKNKVTENPFVLYPTLIDRYFEGGILKEEASFDVPMRVYYPDEFKKTIEDHGFNITDSWGGYEGKTYGDEKEELVVKFKAVDSAAE